ncbi:PREDICTED: uncharacterized protein LOC109220693 [Nicotiana attenuata]|uniref:uncharacterized protein LOC109220693 n=1 Tax=Nicotiana attenuata TaxID=49451 RepID=UPI00090568ED|nr:PREDICTED: uncharacterized protein LOC109220693 [Nicotiana attenuata]
MEFFETTKMLKIINSTTIILVPKNNHADEVGDYRPIACCNTIYKITSKMLCNRLKEVLPTIIAENQSAFVEGRSIVQNILICQDLVKLYNRKKSTRKCLIKIDLKKEYDSVEWGFVEEMLHALDFPSRFIKWTMVCISTTQYSMALNGGIYGCINGRRGLRQGDPISPLLFVICMEYFTRIMQWVATLDGFAIHTKCKSLKLNHLCFSDDVLMFYKGDYQSVLLMLRGLQTFSNAFGLSKNAGKSNVYSANIESQCLADICESGYHWRRGELEQWPWSRGVWNRMNNPKHSFICWLAMRRKLLTKDRTLRMGITEDSECMLCDGQAESIDHLFFECTFSKMCLEEVLKWLGMNIKNTEVTGIWRRMTRVAKGKIGRSFPEAMIAAVIYHIWRARNEAVWLQKVPRPQTILKQIPYTCKHRCLEVIQIKKRQKEMSWIERLYK